MTKAFISYHHRNDQRYREHLSYLANVCGAFEDQSVEVGEIDESYSSQSIRRFIRDNYLRDTEVTILLCGSETRFRKHVDWELKSSMIDGAINRRSGILVIDLPTTRSTSWHASLPNEKNAIYSDYAGGWRHVDSKAEYLELYPDMPERIIDNLANPDVRLSVAPWRRIENQPGNLKFLVDATARVAMKNDYDLTLPMRRKNYNPRPAYSY
ncbi:MAG: TIR domain-containing protein [Pseudomonadota bacterium]